MDRNSNESEATDFGRIGEILASEEELAPSSGFLAAVMERVEQEARTPPPIPFPLKRAMPGFVLAAGVLVWFGVELVRLGIPAIQGGQFAPPHLPTNLIQPVEQAAWVTLALGLSFASWLLARRLAGRSGLL